MIMLGISSLISPAVAGKLVKSAIEETLKQKVERFDLIYRHEKQIIDFRIYNVKDPKDPKGQVKEKQLFKYTDEGGKFCAGIRGLMSDHLEEGLTIDYAVIEYPAMKCTIYMTKTVDNEEGLNLTEKIQKEIVL
jgi:hypothetical protein